MVTKKNLLSGRSHYIDTFNHEGPELVNAIYDLSGDFFDRLEINSPTDVYKRVAYTQRIIRGYMLKNYKAFLL